MNMNNGGVWPQIDTMKETKTRKTIALYPNLWDWLQTQADIYTGGNVTAFLEFWISKEIGKGEASETTISKASKLFTKGNHSE